MPAAAPCHATKTQPGASDDAVPAHRLLRVAGAARVEEAARRQPCRDRPPIQAQQANGSAGGFGVRKWQSVDRPVKRRGAGDRTECSRRQGHVPPKLEHVLADCEHTRVVLPPRRRRNAAGRRARRQAAPPLAAAEGRAAPSPPRSCSPENPLGHRPPNKTRMTQERRADGTAPHSRATQGRSPSLVAPLARLLHFPPGGAA